MKTNFARHFFVLSCMLFTTKILQGEKADSVVIKKPACIDSAATEKVAHVEEAYQICATHNNSPLLSNAQKVIPQKLAALLKSLEIAKNELVKNSAISLATFQNLCNQFSAIICLDMQPHMLTQLPSFYSRLGNSVKGLGNYLGNICKSCIEQYANGGICEKDDTDRIMRLIQNRAQQKYCAPCQKTLQAFIALDRNILFRYNDYGQFFFVEKIRKAPIYSQQIKDTDCVRSFDAEENIAKLLNIPPLKNHQGYSFNGTTFLFNVPEEPSSVTEERRFGSLETVTRPMKDNMLYLHWALFDDMGTKQGLSKVFSAFLQNPDFNLKTFQDFQALACKEIAFYGADIEEYNKQFKALESIITSPQHRAAFDEFKKREFTFAELPAGSKYQCIVQAWCIANINRTVYKKPRVSFYWDGKTWSKQDHGRMSLFNGSFIIG